MNAQPCGKCRHYDVIKGPRFKSTGFGRCVPRSIYPTKEGPGQRFPPNAKRAAEGTMPQIEAVRETDTVPTCTQFEAKE